MKNNNKIILIILLAFNSIFSFAKDSTHDNNQKNNQGSGVYQIQSYTISSGGGVISNGNFKVTSSIGQIDAGPKLTGGVFEIKGGFLKENSDLIFKNSFEQ